MAQQKNAKRACEVCVSRKTAETCAKQDILFKDLLAKVSEAEGAAAQAGRTIQILTQKNTDANKRIGKLEAQWQWYVWLGIGVVAGAVATGGVIVLAR